MMTMMVVVLLLKTNVCKASINYVCFFFVFFLFLFVLVSVCVCVCVYVSVPQPRRRRGVDFDNMVR